MGSQRMHRILAGSLGWRCKKGREREAFLPEEIAYGKAKASQEAFLDSRSICKWLPHSRHCSRV